MYIQFGLLYPDLTLLAPTLLQFSMPRAINSSRCIYPSTYIVVTTLWRELFSFWYSFLFVLSY